MGSIGEKLRTFGGWMVALAITALAVSCSVGVASSMPDYAGVYINADSKTYIPLPCFKKWRDKPSTEREVVDLSTAGKARSLRYRVEEGCEAYIMGPSQSLLGSWLTDLGFFGRAEEWWDRPYRTEDGIVYPKKAN